MERRDEVQTNWMGNYFALIGNRLLHSDNGDTRCKLALQLILNGNHKDGSRMLCQYLETVVDVAMNKFLSDNPADDEIFSASLSPTFASLYSELGRLLFSGSSNNEWQWWLLDTSREFDTESMQQILEFAFQNLEKARVIIAGIVLDGVSFMEEFSLNHHHHTYEQQNTMKQDLATILNQLGVIQMLGGLFTPAFEDFYQALKISIEACCGEFHEFVAQSHHYLARAYECYAEHSMSYWEVMRDRRVARLGGVGGQMGEDLPLNNYMKCTEHYLACGVSYAGHLVNICKSNPDEIFTAKNLDTICENISMLKTPPCDEDKELFERI
jgi:hypothetical protein